MAEVAARVSTAVPAIELHGITKRFPGVVANQDIELEVQPASLHAIVGENGAGKSTLMKILYGMQRPDAGTDPGRRAGGPVPLAEGRHRRRHRHGAPALHAGPQLHRPREHRARLRAHARRRSSTSTGRGPDPRAVRRLRHSRWTPTGWSRTWPSASGSGWRSSRSCTEGARILILDEPTAVLVPQEVEELFGHLRGLKAQGVTILFISHKLDEVLAIADAITVMRGRAARWPRSSPGT